MARLGGATGGPAVVAKSAWIREEHQDKPHPPGYNVFFFHAGSQPGDRRIAQTWKRVGENFVFGFGKTAFTDVAAQGRTAQAAALLQTFTERIWPERLGSVEAEDIRSQSAGAKPEAVLEEACECGRARGASRQVSSWIEPRLQIFQSPLFLRWQSDSTETPTGSSTLRAKEQADSSAPQILRERRRREQQLEQRVVSRPQRGAGCR